MATWLEGQSDKYTRDEILRLDRWWIINVINFPKDEKSGWPVGSVERGQPTPKTYEGRLAVAKAYLYQSMRDKGIADAVIDAEWEKLKARYPKPEVSHDSRAKRKGPHRPRR